MTLFCLVKRNTKLFFKDKGTFFTSLITPLILLVLYVTFLGEVYKDSLMASIPKGISISEKLIESCVGSMLFSALLAVSCVTVSFCSNMQMVADKVSGAAGDFKISPIKGTTLSLGYYISTLITTLVVCFVASAACLVYITAVGWYFSPLDILLIFADILLIVMFGTALSSVINFFLSTQGQISAVGTIISSCYGFICGAYMPISSFGEGLRKALLFSPGTYATSLLRNHTLRGVLGEMSEEGAPAELIDGIRKTFDCDIDFFGNTVSVEAMYAVLISTVLILMGVYIFLNIRKRRI